MEKLKAGLIASSIILLTNLAFRLINQSQMMFTFPFDGTDWATHIFELWALGEYSFYGFVPYWYNGYILFQHYNPGWYLFSLLFLKLSGDILVSSFVSIVVLFCLILVGIYLFGKTQKFSTLQIITFFAFFAGNALAIANFIRNGRTPELAGWTIFIFLAALIFYYNDKPLKEKIYVVLCSLVSLSIISFWLIPLLRDFDSTYVSILNYSARFYDMGLFDIGLNIVLPIATIILFVLYWQQKNYSRTELIFFAPVLIFSALLALKLTPILPILNKLYPGPTAIFFLFFALYFLLSLKINTKTAKLSVSIIILILALSSVAINTIDTSLFPQRTDFQKEVLSIIPNIESKYIIAGEGPEFINWGIYTYAAIYHNKSTIWGGWQTTGFTSNYQRRVVGAHNELINSNCAAFAEKLNDLGGNEVLGIKNVCATLQSCGFKEKISTESFCLYEVTI